MSCAAQMRVALLTLGCAKNEVDSELMEEQLLAEGFVLCAEPAEADFVVVNTCAFLLDAIDESIDEILDATNLPRVQDGRAHVVVVGCLPARYGDMLAAELPEVSAFLPCSREEELPAVLHALAATDLQASSNASCDETISPRAHGAQGAYKDMAPCKTTPCMETAVSCRSAENVFFEPYDNRGVSRYVKISDGCDRFCSYCAIPYIRGRFHSFPLEEIRARVAQEKAAGAREIVLIAQDTGCWGTDLKPPSSLAQLLDVLAGEFPDLWFRVLYLEPDGVTEELIDTLVRHENICHYLDIPFQHANAEVLARMNRSGEGARFLELVGELRARIPDVVLRTTLIAGFPGETEEQFQELFDFVCDAQFDYVGVFPYSCEEGTKAAVLDGHLDDEVRLSRAQLLRDEADRISDGRLARFIGETLSVLVEGAEEDGQLYGRAYCQAPEVDGVVFLDKGLVGDVVSVRIDDTMFYEMEGTVL